MFKQIVKRVRVKRLVRFTDRLGDPIDISPGAVLVFEQAGCPIKNLAKPDSLWWVFIGTDIGAGAKFLENEVLNDTKNFEPIPLTFWDHIKNAWWRLWKVPMSFKYVEVGDNV